MSMERPRNDDTGNGNGSSRERQVPEGKMSPRGELYAKKATAAESSAVPVPREYRRKLFFWRQVQDGKTPTSPEARTLLENSLALGENRAALDSGESPATRVLQDHLTARQVDVFDIQKVSGAVTDALCKDTHQLDMLDFLMGMRLMQNILVPYAENASEKKIDRLKTVKEACIRDLVGRVGFLDLRGGDELDITDTFTKLFPSSEPLSIMEQQDLEIASYAIGDRVQISHLIHEGSLQDSGHPFSESPYSKAASSEKLAQLNRTAADTIERLHLLKAYGVTPFEVPGKRLQLPWDIAVEPPIAIDEQGNIAPYYAEGAIADFIFLAPEEQRTDISLRMQEGEGKTIVSAGDAHAQLRLRLHDNGQISSGLHMHNAPSDITEQSFTELGAEASFQRIRGLLIAIAFDALVPDDVTEGERVRGSVASSFHSERQEPAERQITELLLRRRESLRSARVDEENRRPRGWTLPRHDVRGHFRKIPEGANPRPTAEQEAREYYESINLPFTGLPEGKTFVNPHTQGSEDTSVVYRQARFRKSSATAKFSKHL